MEHHYFIKNTFKPTITASTSKKLGIVVVIPSYYELNLKDSIQSLLECEAPQCDVEIIVSVNFPEGSPDDVVQNAQDCISLVDKPEIKYNKNNFSVFAIKAFDLPKKHAGVGLARKIGMDQAAWRLLKSECKTKIIACFDADATCSKNYLVELEKHWLNYPKTEACSIHYEHPISGNAYSESIYNGITQYELHLRYYVQAGKYIKHPHSYQTVGSSMACSASAYLRFGGMNKNKAGEDFYFLQKIIPHGNFYQLNSTTVFPSPRASHRVPFGTGRAMTKHLEANNNDYLTYNINSFLSLKPLFELAPNRLFMADKAAANVFLNQLEPSVIDFLISNQFADAIEEINSNTSTQASFYKRFFQWFDAFKMLKYMNFANEKHFLKQPIVCEAYKLLSLTGASSLYDNMGAKELLELYRQADKNE